MIHKDFNPLSLQQQKSLKEVALRLFVNGNTIRSIVVSYSDYKFTILLITYQKN
jgi:hypothetical protein